MQSQPVRAQRKFYDVENVKRALPSTTAFPHDKTSQAAVWMGRSGDPDGISKPAFGVFIFAGPLKLESLKVENSVKYAC